MKRIKTFLSVVAFLFLLPAVLRAQSWATETVDGATGGGTVLSSLAFSPVSGFAAIAYTSGNGIKLAEWNGASWSVQLVASGGGNGMSLAFDSSGNPALSYGGTNGSWFAHRTGSTWTFQSVDRQGGTGSLRYKDNQPWIAYTTSKALKLAHLVGSSWTSETVDGSGMSYASLAFAPDGNPSIAYRSGTGTSTLKFAHKTGPSWAKQAIETGTYYGIFSSLAYDPLSGNPTIAHGTGSGGIRFAIWDGSQWVLEIAATGYSCSHESLAYGAAGIAAISYDLALDGSGYKQLRFAQRTGCSGACWQDELVEDESPATMSFTSLAIAPTGSAAISYGVYNGILKFAQQTP